MLENSKYFEAIPCDEGRLLRIDQKVFRPEHGITCEYVPSNASAEEIQTAIFKVMRNMEVYGWRLIEIEG